MVLSLARYSEMANEGAAAASSAAVAPMKTILDLVNECDKYVSALFLGYRAF